MRCCWAIAAIVAGQAAIADGVRSTEHDNTRRPITELDLLELLDIRQFSVSPYGNYAAYQVQQASLDTNEYELNWFVASLSTPGLVTKVGDGGQPMWRVSDEGFFAGMMPGTSMTRAPKWSPDGGWLAYLVRQDSVVRVWRSSVDGRTQEQVTRNIGDIADFAWSVDGLRIIFTVDDSSLRIAEALREEGDRGYLVDDRFLPYYSSRPLLAPSDFRSRELSAWSVELHTGEVRRATANESSRLETQASSPSLAGRSSVRVSTLSGDGRTVAWAEPKPDKRDAISFPLLSLYAAGYPELTNVSECVDPQCIGMIHNVWVSESGDRVFFTRREGIAYATTGVYAWSPLTNTVRLIKRTNDALLECEQSRKGLVCLHESALSPRTLVLIDLSTGRLTTLADPNPGIRNLKSSIVQRITWKSDEYDQEGFGRLVFPLEYEEGKQYPLVIVTYRPKGLLRGGVGDEYPIQVLAANGLAVLEFDAPTDWALRSTATSMEELERTERDDERGLKRIKASLDAALDRLMEMDIVDLQRVALTGLSLGAEITLYSIRHSSRISVAAVSSPALDPIFYYLGGLRTQRRVLSWGYGHPSGKDAELWKRSSLSSNIDGVTAPLLIQAPESEYLLVLEAFAAMREAKKPFELYVFPDEKHVKMQPAHRYAVYRRNVQWLLFWLQGVEVSDPVGPEQYTRWRVLRDEHVENFEATGKKYSLPLPIDAATEH